MSVEDFDADKLDDVIHGRLRLGLMAYLASVSPATFNELRDKTGATNGNLSTHLRKLEDAGYVSQKKDFVNRRPRTRVFLTAAGREAWVAYLDQLKSLLDEQG